MPARPVAKQVWTGSTTTGQGTGFFGVEQRVLSAYITNGTTKAFVNKLEVTVGNSTAWIEVLEESTSTGSAVVRSSTAGVVFDKGRINVSVNDTTGDVTVWLAAGP